MYSSFCVQWRFSVLGFHRSCLSQNVTGAMEFVCQHFRPGNIQRERQIKQSFHPTCNFGSDIACRVLFLKCYTKRFLFPFQYTHVHQRGRLESVACPLASFQNRGYISMRTSRFGTSELMVLKNIIVHTWGYVSWNRLSKGWFLSLLWKSWLTPLCNLAFLPFICVHFFFCSDISHWLPFSFLKEVFCPAGRESTSGTYV